LAECLPVRSNFLVLWMSFWLLLPLRASADTFVRDDIVTDPTWQRFSVCYDNGCRSLDYVSLTQQQWEQLRALFFPLAETAAEERERIRAAIALMEQFVGKATGTWQDKGGTFNFGRTGQMDCIDESINTSLYVTMFYKYGMLRHHRIHDRATRGWFLFGWPHTTAVIREEARNALWAVDSWFLDNGEPPFILPLDTWKKGWKPKDCADCLPVAAEEAN
jgi:hypothetical protein